MTFRAKSKNDRVDARKLATLKEGNHEQHADRES
jgi:hypothetical protein